MTGKEKALILLSMLGDTAQNVLRFLSKEKAQFLSQHLDAVEISDKEAASELISEAVELSEQYKSSAAFQKIEALDQKGKIHLEDHSGVSAKQSDVQESSKHKDFQNVANQLLGQKPQVIAFVLSKLDEDTKNQLVSYMPDNLKSDILGRPVEFVPISEKVFENIYKTLFEHPN